MAKPAKHQQADAAGAAPKGGAGQSIVELCDATAQGIVFWSRRRFEIGAQLQVRLRLESLPEELQARTPSAEGWVNLIGLVVVSLAQRREDGSHGFRITLLVPPEPEISVGVSEPPVEMKASGGIFFHHDWLGGCRMGLN